MNDQDIINSEKLESINSELFDAFDLGDESCIGGRGFTDTTESTVIDNIIDARLDMDVQGSDNY